MERRTFLRSGVTAGVIGVAARTGFPSVASARGRAVPEPPIRLSSNENPLGLAPRAREAVIAGIPDANRYPGASSRRLKEALAEKHGVSTDHLVLGAGSTEILQMAVQVFGQGRATFIIAEPTYEDVPRYAEPWNLRLETVPLRADYSHDLDRMREIAHGVSGPALVYICNPNNPTGTLTSSAAVDEWIESADDEDYFMVDEAYFEYAERAPAYWSALRFVESNPRVIVARTFSKIYGMAGMRLGYAIAHPETAAKLQSLAGRNNANHLASMAALASLRDSGLIGRSIEVNDRAQQILFATLDEMDVEYLPSHTNFVMHRIRGDVSDHITRMREHGFAVGRPFPPMLNYNRVSMGTPEQMEQFCHTLKQFRTKGWV